MSNAEHLANVMVEAFIAAVERGVDLVPVVADSTSTAKIAPFIKQFPGRLMNVGIAEQSMIGTAAGPHPFPLLVRELQAIISREARAQMLAQAGRLPDYVVACVGGGSNAIGAFHEFVPDASVKLIGVEAAGSGKPGDWHSAPLSKAGAPGVLLSAEASRAAGRPCRFPPPAYSTCMPARCSPGRCRMSAGRSSSAARRC